MPGRKKRKAQAAPKPERGSFEAWDQGLSEKEKRVDEIVQKMVQGAWLSGVSDRVVAKDWNLAPDTVRALAAEASRVVRRQMRETPEAKEEAKAQILQTFSVIRAKAMIKGDAQSLRVALDATRALGFYLGLEPAKKLDVADRTDPMAGWSAEEKISYAETGKLPRRAASNALNGAARDDMH